MNSGRALSFFWFVRTFTPPYKLTSVCSAAAQELGEVKTGFGLFARRTSLAATARSWKAIEFDHVTHTSRRLRGFWRGSLHTRSVWIALSFGNAL